MSKYFSELNYSLGNEDSGMEVAMVRELGPDKILSVAGCGSRALPLVSCSPESLTCIDLARQQLAITELRYKSMEQFCLNDFLTFWGFPPYSAYDYSFRRKKLFFELELQESTREYFAELFSSLRWQSILYHGKWERTFATFSKAVRLVMKKEIDTLFSFHDVEEQAHYYRNDFPMNKWRSIIFMLGNKSVFNALLYKGEFIKKNVPESHFHYYFYAFERLFTEGLLRKSFFASLCFHGELFHEDANTIETDSVIYHDCQEALTGGTRVNILKANLLELESATKEKFDFVSLSDVPSYFTGDVEKNFLQLLRPSLAPGAIVVVRYYLRVCDADESGFVDITPRFAQIIARERVQMYRVKVLQLED